jgi:hypothetical protein
VAGAPGSPAVPPLPPLAVVLPPLPAPLPGPEPLPPPLPAAPPVSVAPPVPRLAAAPPAPPAPAEVAPPHAPAPRHDPAPDPEALALPPDPARAPVPPAAGIGHAMQIPSAEPSSWQTWIPCPPPAQGHATWDPGTHACSRSPAPAPPQPAANDAARTSARTTAPLGIFICWVISLRLLFLNRENQNERLLGRAWSELRWPRSGAPARASTGGSAPARPRPAARRASPSQL